MAQGIILKINFFYQYPGEKPPKESCIDKAVRTLFTDKPQPYSFSYYPVEMASSIFDDVVRLLKTNFTTVHRLSGIASRSSKSPNKKRNSDSFSSTSLRNSMFRKSNRYMSSSRLRNLTSSAKSSLNLGNNNVVTPHPTKISKILPYVISTTE